MGKPAAAIIFSGQSLEHIVSRTSAANAIEHIDRTRYNILLVGITEEGHQIKADSLDDMETGAWRGGTMTALSSPDTTRKYMILMDGDKIEEVRLGAVFPVLRGLCGGDSTIQGLLELTRISYMGRDVLASAVSVDKLYTKIIVSDLGIRQTEYEAVYREELSAMDQVTERIEEHFPYPVLAKPSNAGSSGGISKVDNRRELMNGLTEAVRHGRKILVEEAVVGREVECAMFGGGTNVVEASGMGEILAAAEFYDFGTKYFDEDSHTVTDPELSDGTVQHVRRAATGMFRTMDGYGLARVDLFVKGDGEVVSNEINTMPGFITINVYPMLWEAEGISRGQLVEKLSSHGMERYAQWKL